MIPVNIFVFVSFVQFVNIVCFALAKRNLLVEYESKKNTVFLRLFHKYDKYDSWVYLDSNELDKYSYIICY